MISFLDEIAAVTVTGGKGFRATGEMSWATGHPRNFEQFFTYESELNRMTSTHAPALLCLFDLDDLDGPALDNVLRHTRTLFTPTASSIIHITGAQTTIAQAAEFRCRRDQRHRNSARPSAPAMVHAEAPPM